MAGDNCLCIEIHVALLCPSTAVLQDCISFTPQFYKAEEEDDISARGFWQAMDNIDYKFILIPLMFILLRIWSIIIHILLVYIQLPPESVPSWILQTLVYFSVSYSPMQAMVGSTMRKMNVVESDLLLLRYNTLYDRIVAAPSNPGNRYSLSCNRALIFSKRSRVKVCSIKS